MSKTSKLKMRPRNYSGTGTKRAQKSSPRVPGCSL